MHRTMGNREAIAYKCMKQGGCGLNCEIITTGDPLFIKFHNPIDNPKDIMFWSSTHLMMRSSHICRKLKETKDPHRRSIVAMRYLDEYYGDATPTINIIGHVQSFFKDNKNSVVVKMVKDSEVSTEHLVKCIKLKANDPASVAF